MLAPGRVAPWNGQLLLPDAARALLDGGIRNTYFVIVGENRRYAKYARAVFKQAQAQGVGPLFRLTGHCRDMPAALLYVSDRVLERGLEPSSST